jgi:TetR/AcrR family transcriptional repressor of nem operon
MSDKREQLEKIAADAVQTAGLGNLSFRTLAERGGVKSSSVHYYFRAKGDLAQALIESYSGEFRSELTRIGASRGSLRDKLERFVDIFETVLSDGKLCLCGAMAAEVTTLDESSQALLKRYFSDAEAWLSEVLGARTDELKTPLAPESFARVLMSGLEGAILIDRVDQSRERLTAMRELVRSATEQ